MTVGCNWWGWPRGKIPIILLIQDDVGPITCLNVRTTRILVAFVASCILHDRSVSSLYHDWLKCHLEMRSGNKTDWAPRVVTKWRREETVKLQKSVPVHDKSVYKYKRQAPAEWYGENIYSNFLSVLFICNLFAALSTADIILQCRMTGCLVNNGLERNTEGRRRGQIWGSTPAFEKTDW